MSTATLPKWLSPGVFCHHKPTGAIFTACHCQKERSTGQILILDAPKGSEGNEYPLSECELATPAHLTGGNPIFVEGKPFTLVRIAGELYQLTNGSKAEGLQIPSDEAHKAAQQLARFFDGAVASEEVQP